MLGVQAAVTRRTRSRAIVDASQAITIDDVMPMMTSVPAWTTFEEGSAGTIQAGKRADVRILDRDPYTTPADGLDRGSVELALLAGSVVYSTGSLLPAT